MSNSPQSKSPNSGKADAKVEFKTSNIGKWASKQENPFAKQNRERQAKKQARNKKRQKAAPYVVAVCGIVAVGLGIWGLVVLIGALTYSPINEDLSLGGNGAVEIQKGAQEVFDKHLQAGANPGNSGNNGSSGSSDGDSNNATTESEQKANEAVQEYFEGWQNSTSDEAKKAQLQLVEMEFYYNNGQFGTVLNMFDKVNKDALSESEQGQFYGMLMNAAFSTDQIELGQYYSGFGNYSNIDESEG